MNRLLAGACALMGVLLTALPSHADDYKGFYAGVNVGGNSGHSNANTSTVFSPTGYFATTSVPAIATVGAQSLSGNGFAGGGQVGFNFQHKAFVFGVEGDFGGGSLSQTKTGSATYPCCAPTAFTITQFVGSSWLVTVRPRLGFTAGPVLIYGTGGLAATSVEYTSVFTDTFANAFESARKTSGQAGWAAGGGVEFKTGKHWSIKGE